MDSIHEILQALERSEERGVLAVIIHVDGSAYLKEGASMLFLEKGRRIGILSAGCLEHDLAEHAKQLLIGGSPKRLVYDMSAEDDLSWGRGTGCNGQIHIWMEALDTDMRSHLETLKQRLDRGIGVTFIRILEGEASGDYLFVAGDEGLEEVFGHWRREKGETVLHTVRRKYRSGIQPDTGWYIYRFHPKPRLFVFGGGVDARPLVSLAARTGFSVTVSDWRTDYGQRIYFPEADEIMIGFPYELIPRLSFRNDDCVVLITHDFQMDRILLQHFILSKLMYLGILGSKARTAKLLEEQTALCRVHSPAGMPIGAQGPEQIAVSIVADLIRCVNEERDH